jgi:hypothetical protein
LWRTTVNLSSFFFFTSMFTRPPKERKV